MKTIFENIGGSYTQQGDYLLPNLTPPTENERQLQKQTVDMKMLYQGLMEFTEMKQLTPTVVNKLIERIEIHNNEKKHSHNNVKVDIYFTAIGLFDILTEQQLVDTMERIKQRNAEISA